MAEADFDLVEIADSRTVVDDSSSGNPLDWSAARWLFLAFAIAFAVKVPLFPLHTWLPDAHTEAPTAGSVILAGVLLKLGTYGLLRFGLYLFPDAANFFAPALVTLGVIGIIYGAVVATMQKDLKRLVAYSSVAHLGFIVLGTFAITTQGIQGGLLQNINHGLSTGALFLLVGMISERRHTRQTPALRGLPQVAPILAAAVQAIAPSSLVSGRRLDPARLDPEAALAPGADAGVVERSDDCEERLRVEQAIGVDGYDDFSARHGYNFIENGTFPVPAHEFYGANSQVGKCIGLRRRCSRRPIAGHANFKMFGRVIRVHKILQATFDSRFLIVGDHYDRDIAYL